MQGYRRTNAYLVTQWPLTETISDLWRMIYEYSVNTVVLLDQHTHNNVLITHGHHLHIQQAYSKISTCLLPRPMAV